jgi:hypothetical protein
VVGSVDGVDRPFLFVRDLISIREHDLPKWKWDVRAIDALDQPFLIWKGLRSIRGYDLQRRE